MSMTKEINQLIEQIKLDLDNYQSQLSDIEVESAQEKESLLEAIRAEEADIRSLLSKYRNLKQQNEVDVVRSSFKSLTTFKQNLLAKIDSESKPCSPLSAAPNFEQNSHNLEQNSHNLEQSSHNLEKQLEANSSSTGDLPKKSEAQPVNGYVGAATKTVEEKNSRSTVISEIEPETESADGFMDTKIQIPKEEKKQSATINQMLKLIDSVNYRDLAKFYPANVNRVVPEFNVLDVGVRDHLIKHYQKRDRNICNALIKLYQKPTIKQEIAVPETKSLDIKDRKYHDFISQNYVNALPFFWFLVQKEPDSIRYVVMECAQDHIIFTNEIDANNHSHQLNLSFAELLEINNGESLEVYLRDIFICFHPQRVSVKNDSKNKYFDYIDNLITQGATLESSKVLKFWSQMKQFGYQTVAADDFPVKND